MKTEWTNKKLFKQIVKNLREQGELSNILEYIIPAFEEEKVNSYELDCLGSLSFGDFVGSDGISVSVYLEGGTKDIKLGTFKTLREDYQSWCIMAQLMADFQWECTVFIEDHIEDFDGEYDDLCQIEGVE